MFFVFLVAAIISNHFIYFVIDVLNIIVQNSFLCFFLFFLLIADDVLDHLASKWITNHIRLRRLLLLWLLFLYSLLIILQGCFCLIHFLLFLILFIYCLLYCFCSKLFTETLNVALFAEFADLLTHTMKEEEDMNCGIETNYSDKSLSTQTSNHWVTNKVTEAHKEVQRKN